MDKLSRNAWWVLAIALLQTTDISGQGLTPSESRLRFESARISDLVQSGAARSATLEQLILAIERTDGLVYLSDGTCMPLIKACLLMRLDQAGPNRMLRIRVTPNRQDDETIVSIGHELQHAMEVLSNDWVRTTDDMFVLYQRLGLDPPASWFQTRTRFRFETRAAIAIGDAIRDELHNARYRK